MTVAAVARLDARRTDESLVLAARAGDREAKAELFRHHVRFASDLAYRLLGRDGEVEDVVQESFVVAFTTLGTLSDPRAFRGWLGAIVTHRTIAVIRKRRLLSRLGFVRAEPIQIESVVSRTAPPDVLVELGAVYRALDELPAVERVVLVLRRVEQLPLETIAERTRLSLATVKRRLARAEQLLVEQSNRTGEH
ncbi:MAG TPA: RNA polymerase sigma factor [Polyangiaceae bacterium]|nr:RNA polymerase sigma factor [Polyangiaceae bacterium]